MLKIEKIQYKSAVYDITVKDNSNFYANNILVHNCTEIFEYSSADETAVCNLASIALSKFVIIEDDRRKKHVNKIKSFDFKKLGEVTEILVENLNKVIDINFYPTTASENSNLRHRPMGIGVQGLADVFMLMGLPFTSDKAKQLNKDIFETIYFHSLKASCRLAKINGTYLSYEGSPVSKGILQMDMWDKNTYQLTDRHDWDQLRKNIKKYGLRNSLLTALMPTASTAQILGNNECFEAYTTNVYSRRLLSGDFMLVNKHLIRDLIDLNLWSTEMKNKIVSDDGSVQYIDEIPDNIKELYKTVWEIKQKDLINMSADRSPYIDQGQSLNLFIANPDINTLSSIHMYTWSLGLKTGMYYLRSRPAKDAQKFTIEEKLDTNSNEALICSIDNPDDCDMCGA